MTRRDVLLVGFGVIVLTLALAWAIEQAHIRALREELNAWNRGEAIGGEPRG